MGTQLEPACYMSHMQVCYTFQPQVSEQKFYKSSISSQRDLCTLLLLLFDVCVCSHTSTVECWALRQLSTVKTDSGLGHWCLEFHMWGMSFHKLLSQQWEGNPLAIQGSVILLFNISIRFKLRVRYWNSNPVKTHLQKIPSSGYWVCLVYSWDHAFCWDRWKILLPSCKRADMPPS